LNLAVWTPDPGRIGLHVVVWISGDTYLNCNTANPHLTGAALAAAGAVVVSAYYRTGRVAVAAPGHARARPGSTDPGPGRDFVC
jgi:carboxylesterase type B